MLGLDAGHVQRNDLPFATFVLELELERNRAEDTFHFNRHTGVTLEPRAIICDYNPADEDLTLYMAVQCPHMSKNLYAKHLGLSEDKVRIICKDVGGSFGIKIHTYSDEMAAGAIAVKMARPVKFIADRLESFVTDIHARDHIVKARAAFNADGELLAVDMDDMTGPGDPGKVVMTYDSWLQVQDECEGRSLGQVDVKGKGQVEIVECYGLQ